MVVAFPTNNQKTIANHIGLAKGFLIIDTNTNEEFYIQNPVMQKIKDEHIDLKNTKEGHRGLGTGRVIPPLLAEAGVDVLVSRDFGEGMIRNLEDFGIIAYKTDKKDIEEVLNKIEDEELKEITPLRYYGRGFGYARGFGRRMGYGFKRGLAQGFRGERCNRINGFRRGAGRGFRRRWED